MLYELSQFLSQFHSGFNVFQYLTLRSILGVLTALSISLIVRANRWRAKAGRTSR